MTVAAPPTWWTGLSAGVAALVAFACGIVLWGYVPPTASLPVLAFALWVLAILGAAWLVIALIGLVKFRAILLSLLTPALVLVTAVLVVLSAPSRVAFAISKGALAELAMDFDGSPAKRWAGAYRVLDVESAQGGCLIYVEGGMVNSVGLAYFPEGAPRLGGPRFDGDIGFREFSGDWYEFVEQF